jgi:HD-like signal output (HDOD) protein
MIQEDQEFLENNPYLNLHPPIPTTTGEAIRLLGVGLNKNLEEIQALRAEIARLKAQSGLMSPNYWKRLFTVAAYGFIAQVIVAGGLYLFALFLRALGG